MLGAQGLLRTPRSGSHQPVTAEDLLALIDRLGVVQIDTISVVARSQYLVLWSRAGHYDRTLFDELLAPRRAVFEYWSHAASIIPMRDYPYYRATMAGAAEDHMWDGLRRWMRENQTLLDDTMATIRALGPQASADFERDPTIAREGPWDWYGPKESRKALEVLWTQGDLMIHSRRGGQRLYDLRERVLKEAFGRRVPRDSHLPTPAEQSRHFTMRTTRALGIVTASWLWDYFRVQDTIAQATTGGSTRSKRAAAEAVLAEQVRLRKLVPVTVEGISEAAYLDRAQLVHLDTIRKDGVEHVTTLLSPFDSLIWHRARAQALFDYDVCFEAYVVPHKRKYGYYCLAILHEGRIVGRLDPKMDRATGTLIIRSIYLEDGEQANPGLVSGLAGAIRGLGRFLGAERVDVGASQPAELTPLLCDALDAMIPVGSARPEATGT